MSGTLDLGSFAGVEQRIPANLEEAAGLGYLPYTLPQACRLQYSVTGDSGRLSSGGTVRAGGTEHSELTVAVRLPGGPPAAVQERRIPDPLSGEVRQMQVLFENFPGGAWLAAGHSSPAVRDALRLQRLRIHLTWLAISRLEASHQPPSGLAALEEYQGLERIEAAWESIRVAAAPQDVDNTLLSVFAGLHQQHALAAAGPVFLVKVNTGLGVQESGAYVNAAGVVRFFGELAY